MSTMGDTGSGFITGADPRPDPNAQPATPGNGPLVIVNGGQTAPVPAPAGNFYTEEQVAAMRAETDQRLADMGAQLQQLTTEREEREAALAAENERLATEARAREEEQMDVRQLLDRRDAEWQSRWDQLQSERATEQAIFARERDWQALQDWRRDRIEQESEYILPELRDLITGNDTTEIDASIEAMKVRTTAILQQVQAAVTSARPPLRAASMTGQPSMGGPMEQQQSFEQVSEADIKAMDNKTYGQYRDRLMRFATRSGQAPPV